VKLPSICNAVYTAGVLKNVIAPIPSAHGGTPGSAVTLSFSVNNLLLFLWKDAVYSIV